MTKKAKGIEGLTGDEARFIKGMANAMRKMGENSDRAKALADFFEATQVISFKLQREFAKLYKTDKVTYLHIASLVRSDYQTFFDQINKATQGTDMEVHLDAQSEFGDPLSMVFSGLMTNNGTLLRANLITWLKDKPSASGIVPLLEELQKLMPELEPGDEIEF